MNELIFLDPYFKEVLWGGKKMKDMYGYDIPSDKTGEAWVVSAGDGKSSIVKNGPYKGQTLEELYKNHRELFGNIKNDVFPLLVKVIDANDDLSVQVHPDDAYAKENENGSLGKTECWYIIDCDPDADIIIGHNAKTKEELTEMIENGEWDKLLNRFPIKPGDFFFIPAGTVHAIRKGTQILEIQQNSDVTYRLYDYDRLQDGKPRELHIKKSIDVINCPHKPAQNTIITKEIENGVDKELVTTPLFTVDEYDITGPVEVENPYPFLIVDVISGEGEVDGTPIKGGDHFIAPNGYDKLNFNGNLKFATTHM